MFFDFLSLLELDFILYIFSAFAFLGVSYLVKTLVVGGV